MKCNLAGLLDQAARCIDPERDTGAYAYALREVAEHVRGVRKGDFTLDEFADFYKVRPETAPLLSTPLSGES